MADVLRWYGIETWQETLYWGLLLVYLLLEKWAFRGRADTGLRAHRWLRWALLVAWLGYLVGAPIEHRWRRDLPLPATPGPLLALAGAALALLGTALRVWSVRVLGAAFSAHIEVRTGQALVQRGPYRCIRHPAYAGNVLQALGMPMLLGAWLAMVVAACFVGLLLRRLTWEEQHLARELPGYEAYRARTRRLLPGVW